MKCDFSPSIKQFLLVDEQVIYKIIRTNFLQNECDFLFLVSMKKLSFLALFSFFLLANSTNGFGQRSKNGSYTVSTSNTVLNSYTTLTANANANATSISVTNNSLTNPVLTSALSPGDLILIIQMQGATMDINTTPTVSWGSGYTVPETFMVNTFGVNGHEWGQVTNYNQAGKFEYAQVASVLGSNGITLTCGLQNNYTTVGKTQILRVPRFTNLIVNTGSSITCPTWNGTTGGIVALEIDQNLTLQVNSLITATGKGFRGGESNDNATNGSFSGSDPLQVGFLGSENNMQGAAKGEGIGGFSPEYDALFSRYCKGAPANGGGAGNNHNAGGGGGSNVGVGVYTGIGVPNPIFNAFWNLEITPIGGQTSSGGGRGGYTYSTSNQNEAVVGPNNNLWSGDKRRNDGGFGGHPLVYDETRVFMGGGGGAGDQNFATAPNQVGIGGAGGGIVLIEVYGSIIGTGRIESNGATGGSSNPTNNTNPGPTQKFGNDGAGGAGGGGTIRISNNIPIPTSINLHANGGVGGNHAFYAGAFASSPTMEADGPGGGGAGGLVTISSGNPVIQVNGGANGTSNSTHISNFPPNGATSGASGLSNLDVDFYDLIVENESSCGNASVTLEVSVIGTLPAGSLVNWFTDPFSGSAIATGLTLTTPILSSTTTYYVGICPGDFRKPVVVSIGQNPIITGTALISNVSCSGGDGSITGLTTSGGVAPLTFSWNGNATSTTELTNVNAGSYTLTVTDAIGCSSTSGPYSIGSAAGPTVDASAIQITNTSCTTNTGTITGITHTGGVSFEWNGVPSSQIDLTASPAGSFTLTVIDINGCEASAGPFVISAPASPIIDETNVVSQNPTCGLTNGSISGITVTGNGNTLTWTSTTQTNLDLNNLGAGSYTLTVVDSDGCSSTSNDFILTDAGAIVLNVTNLQTTAASCNGSDGAISGISVSGGTQPYQYSWSNGGNALDLNALVAGNYTLTVTDNLGCVTVSNPITISNTSGPMIDATNVIITNESCLGNDGSITGIVVSGSNLNFAWNGTVGGATLSSIPAGTYTLTVVDGNNCIAQSGPYVVGGQTPFTLDSTNLVISASACDSPTGSISGLQITGGVSPIFTWTGTNSTSLNPSNLTGGNYTLTVIDAQGCSLSTSFTIPFEVGPALSGTPIVTNTTCGENNGSITGLSSSGIPVQSISWSNTTQNTFDINNLSPGNYTLTLIGNNGCQTTSNQFTIGNSQGVTADFGFAPSTIEIGSTVQFTDNSSANVVSWEWSIGGMIVSEENPNYTFNESGEFLVTLFVENAQGCTDVISQVIRVGTDLAIPNVITPNGDGKNDTFFITGLQPETSVQIFNRWGNLVFDASEYENDWQGTDISGRKLVPGVYTFRIETKLGEISHGFIHLND